MNEITKLQFWALEDKFKRNYHGELLNDFTWHSADNSGTRYKTQKDNVIVMESKKIECKMHYFVDERLLVLID